MIFSPFEVVTVPFPFTDSGASKKRPALVLSTRSFNNRAGHSLMAMITSAKNKPWPLDVPLADLKSAGLPAPSVVRMKLFTLDNRFVLSQIGSLNKHDKKAVIDSFSSLVDLS